MKTHFCVNERTTITFEGTCNWCDETEMKPTHKIAYDYAMAMILQRSGEEQVKRAFLALGSDNEIFALAEPIEGAYTTLVCELIGEHLFDWLMWWMYETECGKVPAKFTLLNKTYDVNDMTLYKFLEIVDV